MPTFAITLIIISAFMHAAWNLLARHQRREATFIWRTLVMNAAIFLLPVAVSEIVAPTLNTTAWICVTGSGICCGFYYLGLVRAYNSSDFTVVYPVARALPVLLVGVCDVMRGAQPSAAGWLGMGMVVAGCLMTPLHTFRDFAARRYLNRSMLWIGLTALGTTGYTMLDKAAAEVVSSGPRAAATYCGVFLFNALLVYSLLLRVFRVRDPQPDSVGWRKPVIAATLNFGAYWLVLWAYQMARHASYIVAFRQFSIVIGVVLAFVLFHEKGRAVRITGTVLITAGLILIGLLGE